MARILITGANGQLGSAIKQLAEEFKPFHFFYADLPELDISDSDKLNKFVEGSKPDYIINCAAYTAVDDAESQGKKAFLINAEGVKNLSEVSIIKGIRLFHISTDYIFDGQNYKPYTEEDTPNPQTTYGKSKLKGEEYLKNTINSVIIRTSWLYSGMQQSFYRKILNAATQKSGIRVVYDQIGTPTYAPDLGRAILEIINRIESRKTVFTPGIYHFSNEGVASWYDFAFEILQLTGVHCIIKPVESDEYPSKTPRPHYSVLSKNKIKKTYGLHIPYWKDSLKKLVAETF